MVSISALVVGGALSSLCLYYAYRLVSALSLYASLSGVSPGSAPAMVDGESVTVEGTVRVAEPSPASDRIFDGDHFRVAMYVWRAAFPRSGQTVIDLRNRETKQAKATFASGVESGSFTVSSERGPIRIDPDWLRDVHDATRLAELRPVGFLPSRTWHRYLWRSPYVRLRDRSTEVSLQRLRSAIDAGADIDLSEEVFEAKAVTEGTHLTVHGELSADGGVPSVGGTDDTPLVVSDGGLEAVRGTLRRRAATYAVYLSAALLADTLAILAFW